MNEPGATRRNVLGHDGEGLLIARYVTPIRYAPEDEIDRDAWAT